MTGDSRQEKSSRTLLEIARTANSTLATEQVLRQTVYRVAALLDDTFRCSIVFVGPDSHLGRVVASSDIPDFEPLDIELDKYPELRKAMATGRPVVIDDIRTSPLLESVRAEIDTDRFNSVLVLPVIYRKQAVGALIVRALRSGSGFSQDEIRFCELVAHLSAGVMQRIVSAPAGGDESGAPAGREAEDKKKLSVKAIYELLFENASDGLGAIDPEQNILFINRRAIDIAGYDREELQDMTFLSLLDSASQDRFVASLASQKTLIARNQTFDVTLRRGDGRNRILSVALGERPLSGDLQVLSFRDVTERRRIERQLQETRSELEQANRRLRDMDRSRTEFYNTAAHELRTPVAVVNGYCELLALSDRSNLNEKQREYLDQIGRSGDRLIDLIHNLLDLSRFEYGKMPVNREENDLSDLIREVGQEVRSLVDTKGLTIEVSAGPLVMLSYDPIMIRRALMNLVGNAVKYTPEGGRIRIVLDEDIDEVRVCVSDTGAGISQPEQQKLFREFARLSRSSGAEGSGLGLAITKKIVDAHDGRIWVQSTPGEGSRFTFAIPKSPVSGQPDDA